jgi:hypothetical protein
MLSYGSGELTKVENRSDLPSAENFITCTAVAAELTDLRKALTVVGHGLKV